MSLQVPCDNLQDVVTFEMEDLVDYEDSEKDDQRWTDGSWEGNLMANESGNIGEGLDESLATTTEASGQTT